MALRANCARHGIPLHRLGDAGQGIVHVIAPEMGLVQPGSLVVCGDSHTSTHGAFGALAFGIGTSEVEHVLATQTLAAQSGPPGAGAPGRVPGAGVRALSMEGRMTLCNMSIEWGARAGLVAVDDTTIEHLRARPFAPPERGLDGRGTGLAGMRERRRRRLRHHGAARRHRP